MCRHANYPNYSVISVVTHNTAGGFAHLWPADFPIKRREKKSLHSTFYLNAN